MTEFLSRYSDWLIKAIGFHLYYVLLSVAIALLASLILGILLSRVPGWASVLLPVLSVFQTIPGIVFLGILLLYMGMRMSTVITALSIYAVFPILKNTYVGLVEVPRENKEAAKGCGMSPVQSLFRVELPLALPSIISGVRMSTVYTTSWAVIAAMIGMGGLGDFIYMGVGGNDNRLILAGAIPAAVMAILLSQIIDLIGKALIPKPLRRGRK